MTDRTIRKILIANRGEIAVRVIRTCRELNIRTVAVFSEADRAAVHVQMADEAYCIGPAPSSESYLRTDKIIDAARTSGADAIHPGYGFLSENGGFAEACEAAGIRFIGPPAGAIRIMGDKTAAKALMREAGVPLVPGTSESVADVVEAARVGEEIGFPILLKAAAGGGGKGMRVVQKPEELERSLIAAQNEARAAFGDERVFIEKYVAAPRHVEIQVLADRHGNVVNLFERECSVQRRHQKVIEEAPCVMLTPELRRRMGEAAVAAARACGYENAGTVEFLVDADRNFYFMEMNTRLQVEHPVTEWITGIDLVAEQIRIAEGDELSVAQADLRINGHAIECRIYAEDPRNDFLPDVGRLTRYKPPSGPGVRVDDGVDQGLEIPVHYDPMIAKLTTWGQTRDQAICRMTRALDEYEIAGVATTIPFCRFAVNSAPFQAGDYNTQFVARYFEPASLPASDDRASIPAAIAAALSRGAENGSGPLSPEAAVTTNWRRRRRWRS